MKALTICQPYADMIVKGEKIIENRSWPTSYRGPIAIHAGKSRSWMDEYDELDRPDMVFGAVVAMADLIACMRVDDLPMELLNREDANGPWCWILAKVQPVVPPIVVNGSQGLWEFRAPPEAAKCMGTQAVSIGRVVPASGWGHGAASRNGGRTARNDGKPSVRHTGR